MGDHHLWQKSNFLKGSCNIPLIITPPLRAKGDKLDEYLGSQWMPGTVNHSVVGLQDIMPTILDLAGAEIPEHIDGKSLLPLVKDSTEAVREVILGEFGSNGRRSMMLTDGKWKYIWYEEDGFELLFNLEEDPNELRNLSSKEPWMREEWRRKLVDVLSGRENDPAVDGQQLKATSPGSKLSPMEIEKRVNSYPYRHPMGLH